MKNAKIKKMNFKYKNFERLEEKMREIHKIIKIEREKRKYKQTELAKYLGTTQSTYSKLERGDQKILAEDLAKLARLYGISFDDLLMVDFREDEKK